MQTNQLVHWSCIIRGLKTPSGYKKLWDQEWMQEFAKKLNDSTKIKDFVIGDEVGESGNPHLQIYLRMSKKTRLSPLLEEVTKMAKLDIKQIQLQPADSPRNLREYCKKDGQIITKKDFISPHEKELRDSTLNPFQQQIYYAVHECNSRQLVLTSCRQGNTGKTWLCKKLHASAEYDTIVFPSSGTLNSSLYAIARTLDDFRRQKSDKEILVIINIARSDVRVEKDNISSLMTALECVKDGFFSSSWMGKIYTINEDPKKIKILIVSNLPANHFCNLLSKDRWKIITKE